MKIMSGNGNLPLARAIAAYLELPLTEASVRRFADEEVFVEIHGERARRGRFHCPVDRLSSQRQPHGTAHLH